MDYELPRGFAAVGLRNPKDPINIGSVLRAAGIYDASLVATSGQRYDPKVRTNTKQAHKEIPLLAGLDDIFEAMPYDCAPVAVEMREEAVWLPDYEHLPRAFYIFGGEDQSLGKATIQRCRDVVAIPAGVHNLAAAVNVVLYDRRAKQMKRARGE